MTTQRRQSYWAEYAWLPDGLAEGVLIECADGAVTRVTRGAPKRGDVLGGLTVPGLANAHSHAFHRALRGRSGADRGSFWTWRQEMYALADKLTPESYYRLARAVYGEMVLAGMTSVGEFHYLHHQPGGTPYDEPNEMADALMRAARDAGIRITLLDTCYLTGGIDRPLAGVQLRFSDTDVDGWQDRVSRLRPAGEHARIGAAIHSVRAVPREQLPAVARWARESSVPLHVHLSEQVQENESCVEYYGMRPAELLDDAGALGEHVTAVHATHLTDQEAALLGGTGTGACFCPTTERDLGDGIGPAAGLAAHQVRLSLGSDSHAVIDPFEEMRGLEMNERLASQQRGVFPPGELLAAGTRHSAIGWDEVGVIERGRAADLVSIDLESARTAGVPPDGALLAATAADVRDVVIGGRRVVHNGAHELLGDVKRLLAQEIRGMWS